MKSVLAYSIVDRLSESVLATFYCPNVAMAKKTFENYLSDVEKKTGDKDIASQFYCVICDGFVTIPESYDEATKLQIFSDGADTLFREVENEA